MPQGAGERGCGGGLPWRVRRQGSAGLAPGPASESRLRHRAVSSSSPSSPPRGLIGRWEGVFGIQRVSPRPEATLGCCRPGRPMACRAGRTGKDHRSRYYYPCRLSKTLSPTLSSDPTRSPDHRPAADAPNNQLPEAGRFGGIQEPQAFPRGDETAAVLSVARETSPEAEPGKRSCAVSRASRLHRTAEVDSPFETPSGCAGRLRQSLSQRTAFRCRRSRARRRNTAGERAKEKGKKDKLGARRGLTRSAPPHPSRVPLHRPAERGSSFGSAIATPSREPPGVVHRGMPLLI